MQSCYDIHIWSPSRLAGWPVHEIQENRTSFLVMSAFSKDRREKSTWASTFGYTVLHIFFDGTKFTSVLSSRLMSPQAVKKGIFLDATDHLILYVSLFQKGTLHAKSQSLHSSLAGFESADDREANQWRDGVGHLRVKGVVSIIPFYSSTEKIPEITRISRVKRERKNSPSKTSRCSASAPRPPRSRPPSQ